MKTRLLILSLFFCLSSFAQVPNTATFSYWDVLDAVIGSHPAFTNLTQTFSDADGSKFDGHYYPYYLPAGVFNNAHNSLLNFRNYNGANRGVPAPVATNASSISYAGFTANWNASDGVTSYYIDVSTTSDFSSLVWDNVETMLFPNHEQSIYDYTGSYIYPGTTYYYRLRADTPNGMSGNSNWISVTTTFWESPPGYSWQLTSATELVEIYDAFPGVYLQSVCHIQPATYWSRVEYDATHAYYANYLLGTFPSNGLKTTSMHARAIRTFFTGNSYNIGDTGPAGGIITYKAGQGPTYTYREITPSDQSNGANWADANIICDNL